MADATRSTATRIAGLLSEVTINVDQWGVAHIRAENLHDLFFAQGFNAARDRLWQIDIARKRGLGLLARDFGPGYLEQDRAARLLLYRGDMAPEWTAYGRIRNRYARLLLKASMHISMPVKQASGHFRRSSLCSVTSLIVGVL